jgi:hypothetical protein
MQWFQLHFIEKISGKMPRLNNCDSMNRETRENVQSRSLPRAIKTNCSRVMAEETMAAT